MTTLAPQGFASNIRALWRLMSGKRRAQLLVTLALMALGAVAELATIGAVLPFLAIAAGVGGVETMPQVHSAVRQLGAAMGGDAILAAALVLIAAAVFSIAARLVLTWFTQVFVYGLYYDLSLNIYGRVVRQRYDHYVRQNSSAVLSGIGKIDVVTSGVVAPLMSAVTSAGMALCIVVFLFMVDPVTAALASGAMGLLYLGISMASRRLLLRISTGDAAARTQRIKLLQESLGGMREVILDNSHGVFERRLAGLEAAIRRYRVQATFLSIAPRFVVEGVGIALIALLAIHFSRQPGGVMGAIPVLGALALGAQRLLPLVQAVYAGWASYSYNAQNVSDILELMQTPCRPERTLGGATPRPFCEIALHEVSFGYAGRGGRQAVDSICLTIRAGERIGVIGKTGSGKSTLVDVLMGLLEPSSGELRVDGTAVGSAGIADWQGQIAHVPQAIFLADDSIAANIAFGCDGTPDLDRVWRAAERARLGDFIAELPDGILTEIGERGVRLSGGQRQRIGIARALYKNARLLVLDEATSALDSETEAAIMESVASLERDLTIVLIAHRLTTLAGCDRIYRLEGGRIVAQGAYGDVVMSASRPIPEQTTDVRAE